MLYKANASGCSDIHTQHITQCDHHVEFLKDNPGGKGSNGYALKF